jgi:Lar family restriction alleviation protein
MPAESSTPLKPCPFCGGPAATRTELLDERYSYAERVFCGCPACGVSFKAVGDTSKGGYADNSKVHAQAVAGWNRRACP